MSTSGDGGGWEIGAGGLPGGEDDLGERRSRKRTKQGVYTSDITVEDLARHFHQPASKACQELGMGLTIFKRVCRKLGLQRWPYEKPCRADGTGTPGSQQGLQQTPAGLPLLDFGSGAGSGTGGAGGGGGSGFLPLPTQQQWQQAQGPAGGSGAQALPLPPAVAGFLQQQQAQAQQAFWNPAAGGGGVMQRDPQQQPSASWQPLLQQAPAGGGGGGGPGGGVGGGLSEWAPPKQQLQSPPNVGRLLSAFAQRPLAAALDVGASRPQAGGEELLLAAAQMEAALQQRGGGLKSAAIQRLAEVLVKDADAAHELLAAIGHAIQQQQAAAAPAPSPRQQQEQEQRQQQRQQQLERGLAQVLPAWAAPPRLQQAPQQQAAQPQRAVPYATSEPMAVLQQQCHLPANLLLQQPLPQPGRPAKQQQGGLGGDASEGPGSSQVASVIQALRWVMQHPEEQQQPPLQQQQQQQQPPKQETAPQPPQQQPQPEGRQVGDDAQLSPLLLRLLNWRQQQLEHLEQPQRGQQQQQQVAPPALSPTPTSAAAAAAAGAGGSQRSLSSLLGQPEPEPMAVDGTSPLHPAAATQQQQQQGLGSAFLEASQPPLAGPAPEQPAPLEGASPAGKAARSEGDSAAPPAPPPADAAAATTAGASSGGTGASGVVPESSLPSVFATDISLTASKQLPPVAAGAQLHSQQQLQQLLRQRRGGEAAGELGASGQQALAGVLGTGALPPGALVLLAAALSGAGAAQQAGATLQDGAASEGNGSVTADLLAAGSSITPPCAKPSGAGEAQAPQHQQQQSEWGEPPPQQGHSAP